MAPVETIVVLADAIARACEEHPDVLLDAATLTGAQLVELGTRTCGVMGNDDELRAAVVAAAGRAGEGAWPLPLPAELRAERRHRSRRPDVRGVRRVDRQVALPAGPGHVSVAG
jgi:leucyl aminopeptidase